MNRNDAMIRKLIPKPIRKRLGKLPFIKSPVWWANFGPVSRYLANRIKPLSPPVVILSLPRSGSSWVGEILGLSPTAMYLREPITQSFLRRYPKSYSYFEFDEATKPNIYDLSAKNVFSGLPLFNHWITIHSNQWNLSKRVHRRIVTKEVNPFMLSWLFENFHPRIIYLIRHPVAVTYSFDRMGWSGKKFESRLSKETLEEKIPHYRKFTHSFWAEHGAFQAFVLNEICKNQKENESFSIVRYEDLCADPVNEYKKLFEFAQLEWNDAVERKILERCNPCKINNNAYSTQRDTAYEAKKWKKEVPLEKIRELKQAYLSFDPAYYKDDWPQ